MGSAHPSADTTTEQSRPPTAGGNLLWLGATSGTRDSMHFELKTRPDLGYEAPN